MIINAVVWRSEEGRPASRGGASACSCRARSTSVFSSAATSS